MADTEQHGPQTAAFAESNLTRRLLRRAAKPYGVIDVRHASLLHSRCSFGLGAKLALLDSFKNRYGLGQASDSGASTPAANMPLLTAVDRMAIAGSHDGFPTGLAGRAATPADTTSAAQPASPLPQYRVKRPDRQSTVGISRPSSSQPTQSIVTAEMLASADPAPAAPLRRKTNTKSLHTGTSRTATPMSQASPLSMDGTSITRAQSITAGTLSETNELSPHPRLAHARHMPGPHALAMTVVTALVGEQDHSAPRPTRDISLVMRQRRSGAASDGPSRLRRGIDGQSAVSLYGGNGVPAAAGGSQISTVSGGGGFQPQRKPRSAEQVVQTAPTLTALPLADASPPSTAVVAEIGVPPSYLGASNMVWRKTDSNVSGNQRTRPAVAVNTGSANGVETIRQVPAGAEPGATPLPFVIPARGRSGLDIAHIAEQVGRIIVRQLRIERERRGGR